jgi:hypothetical protein
MQPFNSNYAHSSKSNNSKSHLPVHAPGDPEKHDGRPSASQQTSSWDVLGGIKSDYAKFDPRNAPTVKYADGDIPKTGLVKFYHYLLNVSIVTRWALFIIPVLGILWIPGILGYTAKPNAYVIRAP